MYVTEREYFVKIHDSTFHRPKGALRQCFPHKGHDVPNCCCVTFLFKCTVLPFKTPHQAWYFGNVPVMSLEIFGRFFSTIIKDGRERLV